MADSRTWLAQAWQEAEEDRYEAELNKQPYILRYFFDIDICLWAANERAKKAFGYPVDLEDLPLSEKLLQRAKHLTYLWDSVLNWGSIDQTASETMQQWESFKADALQFVKDLQQELGPAFEIIDCTGY